MASRHLTAFASKRAWGSGKGLPMNLPAVLVTLDSLASSCSLRLLKGTLFIRTKHNQQLFEVIPFIKLQNDT